MGWNKSGCHSFTGKISGLTAIILVLSLFFVASAFSADGFYLTNGIDDNAIDITANGGTQTATIDVDGIAQDGVGDTAPAFTGVAASSDVTLTFGLDVIGTPLSGTVSGAVGLILQQEGTPSRAIHCVVNPVQVATDGTITVQSTATLYIWAKRSSGTFFSSAPLNVGADVFTTDPLTGVMTLSLSSLIAKVPQLDVDPTGYYTYKVFFSSKFPLGYYVSASSVTILPQIGLTSAASAPYLQGSGGLFWNTSYGSTISDSIVSLLSNAFMIQGRLQINSATASGLSALTPPTPVVPVVSEPVAQSVSPALISNDIQNTVSILGENFTSDNIFTVFMSRVGSIVPAAASACSGTFEAPGTFVSNTKITYTVPMNTTTGVYAVSVCIGSMDVTKDGTALELRITQPAVTNTEQDAIDAAVDSISTTELEDMLDASGGAPLNDTQLTDLGLTALVGNTDVEVTIEVTDSGELEVTATTTEPVNPTSTGTMPIQYTLESSVDPDATPIDPEKNVSIKATLPKDVALTTAGGTPYTGAILPPTQEVVPDDMQDDFAGTAVAFSMGSPDQTIMLSEPVYVDFTITLPSSAAEPKIYYLNSNGSMSLAGIMGTHGGISIASGGTIISQTTAGGNITYNIGVLLDHMSTFIAGSYSPGLDGPSSIACFISTLMSGM